MFGGEKLSLASNCISRLNSIELRLALEPVACIVGWILFSTAQCHIDRHCYDLTLLLSGQSISCSCPASLSLPHHALSAKGHKLTRYCVAMTRTSIIVVQFSESRCHMGQCSQQRLSSCEISDFIKIFPAILLNIGSLACHSASELCPLAVYPVSRSVGRPGHSGYKTADVAGILCCSAPNTGPRGGC